MNWFLRLHFIFLALLLVVIATLGCEEFKKRLSYQIGTVAHCFSVYMSPVSLCGWCSQPLQDLQAIAFNQSARSSSGLMCIDIVMSTDKAAFNLLQFTTDIWNRSFCQHCLSQGNQSEPLPSNRQPLVWPVPITSSSLVPTLSHNQTIGPYNLSAYNNDTVEFFRRLTSALDCFMTHIEGLTVSILDSLSFPAHDVLTVNQSVCTNCSSFYTELLRFYNERIVRLNVERGEFRVLDYDKYTNFRFAVCSDIQYALNRTQWAWSQLLQCHEVKSFAPQVLLPLAICCVTIIVFHILLCTAFHNPIRVLIYQTKRVQPVSRYSRLPVTSSGTGPLIRNITSYGTLEPSTSQAQDDQADVVNSHPQREPSERDRLLE